MSKVSDFLDLLTPHEQLEFIIHKFYTDLLTSEDNAIKVHSNFSKLKNYIQELKNGEILSKKFLNVYQQCQNTKLENNNNDDEEDEVDYDDDDISTLGDAWLEQESYTTSLSQEETK